MNRRSILKALSIAPVIAAGVTPKSSAAGQADDTLQGTIAKDDWLVSIKANGDMLELHGAFPLHLAEEIAESIVRSAESQRWCLDNVPGW